MKLLVAILNKPLVLLPLIAVLCFGALMVTCTYSMGIKMIHEIEIKK